MLLKDTVLTFNTHGLTFNAQVKAQDNINFKYYYVNKENNTI